MTEEKVEFTRKLLILGNLGIAAWVLLAFLGLWFYNQIYSWLYLIFSVFVVYVVLRRLGCSSCYMCKTCTSGFGRLAGAFFGRGNTKKLSVGNRLGFVVFVYFLLFLLPAAFLFLTLWAAFSLVGVAVLVLLFALSVYSLTTWFKWSVTRKQ